METAEIQMRDWAVADNQGSDQVIAMTGNTEPGWPEPELPEKITHRALQIFTPSVEKIKTNDPVWEFISFTARLVQCIQL